MNSNLEVETESDNRNALTVAMSDQFQGYMVQNELINWKSNRQKKKIIFKSQNSDRSQTINDLEEIKQGEHINKWVSLTSDDESDKTIEKIEKRKSKWGQHNFASFSKSDGTEEL